MCRYLLPTILAVLFTGCSIPTMRPKGFSGGKLNFTEYDQGISTIDIQHSFSDPNVALTLRDAVRLTLLHNSELEATSYDIKIAEARHLQAGLWRNPMLELETENIGGSGSFSGFDSAETTIQFSQIIELGDKIEKRQRAVAYNSRLAEIEYNAKLLDVTSELTKAFVTLLFIQEKQALSEELVCISNEVVSSVEKLVQGGKADSIDLSRARIGLAKAKIQKLDITKAYDLTRVQLASYWNSYNPSFSTAAGRLDELSDLPDFENLRIQIKNNPDIIQSAITVQKRKAEMILADSERIGDLKIAGGVKHFNDNDDTAFVFGVSIPLTISDRNQGQRQAAAHQYQKAQKMQMVSELSVWNELNRLYAELHTAYMTAIMLRDEVMPAAEQMFNAAQVSYQQGKLNYLELLDSQRTYFASKNEYIDALATYHIAKTELERLIGQSMRQINTSND